MSLIETDDDVFNGGKRKRVNRACSQCQKQHLACNEGRPCQRCSDRGIGHLCKDGERKQRGRKRKSRGNGPDLKSSGHHSFTDADSDDGSAEDAYIPPPPTTKRQQQLLLLRQRQTQSQTLVANAPHSPQLSLISPSDSSSLVLHAPQPKRAKRAEVFVDIDGEGESVIQTYASSIPEPTASAGPSPAPPSRGAMHSPPPQGTIDPNALLSYSDLAFDSDGTVDSLDDEEMSTPNTILTHSDSASSCYPTHDDTTSKPSRSHANIPRLFCEDPALASRLVLSSAAPTGAMLASSPMGCSAEAHFTSNQLPDDAFGNLDEFFEKDRQLSTAFPSSWNDRHSYLPLDHFY